VVDLEQQGLVGLDDQGAVAHPFIVTHHDGAMDDVGVPFQVRVDPAVVADLRAVLARTRWPEPQTVDDWSQGVPLAVARQVAEHWAHGYDMARLERRLNVHPQALVELDGCSIHMLTARSPHPDALPLLLTHGWPGSVVEFLDVIPLLTDPPDPADAFHVICPTLPGFGWSGKPTADGWSVERIAKAWTELMARQGITRYGAAGGDWGAFITAALGTHDPGHVVGIHLTLPRAPEVPEAPVTEDEQAGLASTAEFRKRGSGYSAIQSTRPQTVGYGLVDSPVAQLTWILDKFWAWTDHDGDFETAVDRDTVLDNVMTYWLTASGASSARIYWESFPRHLGSDPVSVPTGASIFPKEIAKIPRSWAQARFRDLRYWNTDLTQGGHFASLEVPETYADELRKFFRLVR
jgi:pimeloyl-ACP methyl ester carboxylesterase